MYYDSHLTFPNHKKKSWNLFFFSSFCSFLLWIKRTFYPRRNKNNSPWIILLQLGDSVLWVFCPEKTVGYHHWRWDAELCGHCFLRTVESKQQHSLNSFLTDPFITAATPGWEACPHSGLGNLIFSLGQRVWKTKLLWSYECHCKPFKKSWLIFSRPVPS